MKEEDPYLLSMAFPCGPWSLSQRMQVDRGTVDEKRRICIWIFNWMKKLVKRQREKGRITMMEIP